MPEVPKRLAPLGDVLRKLYLLSGNQCAFPGCDHPIILGSGTYVGELCHIRAAEPGGERFDRSQTNEERRSFENLLLMCHDHHVVTNDVDRYPVNRMIEIKSTHEGRFARGLADLASSAGIEIVDSIVSLGGAGGSAPGAGGGGGGAIGPNSRGGDGGPGGRLTDFGELDIESLLLALPDGRPAGTGGGGASASGLDSAGGNGGGGGDTVFGALDGAMLRRLGIARISLRVGEGGAPGQDGDPTGMDLIDDGGNIIISVNAPGGRSGDSQFRTEAQSFESTPSPARVARLDVHAAFLANSIEIRDGLFSALSGGWCSYTCESLPAEVTWPFAMKMSVAGVQPGGSIKIFIVLRCPNATEEILETLTISRTYQESDPCWMGALCLKPTITRIGVWTISIRSPARELASFPIEVRQRV